MILYCTSLHFTNWSFLISKLKPSHSGIFALYKECRSNGVYTAMTHIREKKTWNIKKQAGPNWYLISMGLWVQVGCPSKLVSIRNNRNWNRNLFRHYPKHNVCFASMYTETESFDVSIEPKQTKDKPKQFVREHILQFFTENFWFFRIFLFFHFFLGFSVFFSFFSVCFETVCFGVSVVSLQYRNREFRLIQNKQKTHPNSLKESIFGYFSENLGLFRFVSVCYETVLFVSVVSI